MSLVPDTTPHQSATATEQMLRTGGVANGFALLGIRGYYPHLLGNFDGWEKGVYDDAIILLTPTTYQCFNASCEASRPKHGTASLLEGLYSYKIGTHGICKPVGRRHEALIQDSLVKISRLGSPGVQLGFFGINIHRGGDDGTSSEGCQTIHPSQWDRFIGLTRGELTRHGRHRIPYLLVRSEHPLE